MSLVLNGHKVDVTIFPDGTSQVWKLPDKALANLKTPRVEWYFESEAEVMHLAQLARLLDTLSLYTCDKHLYIDYLPYARQDKPVSNETCFALYAFLGILHSVHFTTIEVLDPHGPDSLRYITPIYPVDKILAAKRMTEATLFCYPDNSARKKYEALFPDEKFLYFDKVRNSSTGEITEQTAILLRDPKDENVLIVDDICDGGDTFKRAASLLYEQGAKEVHLFVTHGLFTKGVDTLRESGIKRIFDKTGERFK